MSDHQQLPTYLQRDGHSICTTCGAVVGGASADQIRHTTWHTMLAALLPPDIQSGTGDAPDGAPTLRER